MTAIDLSDLSLKDLKQLQKDVAKALDSFGTRKKSEALSVLEAKAQEFGFSLADLMGVITPRKSPGPAGAKYRHPENPEITWSGRGRQPAWFKAVVNAGQAAETMAV